MSFLRTKSRKMCNIKIVNKHHLSPVVTNILQMLRSMNYVNLICESNLHAIRKHNTYRLIIGQLNINSVRHEFEGLVQQLTRNIDILMVLETKLDNSFPENQFLIDGCTSPFRLDRDNNGGYPMKFLSVKNHPMEGFNIEINFPGTKWLLCCSSNPNRCKIDFHVKNLNPSLALHPSHYENFIN